MYILNYSFSMVLYDKILLIFSSERSLLLIYLYNFDYYYIYNKDIYILLVSLLNFK